MLSQSNSPLITFDADFFALICDSKALSTTIAHLWDFIRNKYRKLSRVIVSDIASGLKVAGTGLVHYKYKSDSD